MNYPQFSSTAADDFVIGDLRDPSVCKGILDWPFDEVYQLAVVMGGAGYIFTGEHDADAMHNSATINLNMVSLFHGAGGKKSFYSSSDCIYAAYNQLDPEIPKLSEDSGEAEMGSLETPEARVARHLRLDQRAGKEKTHIIGIAM